MQAKRVATRLCIFEGEIRATVTRTPKNASVFEEPLGRTVVVTASTHGEGERLSLWERVSLGSRERAPIALTLTCALNSWRSHKGGENRRLIRQKRKRANPIVRICSFSGGEGEIRTLEPCYGLHDFQSCALDQLGDFSICWISIPHLFSKIKSFCKFFYYFFNSI